jgi:hypothetical protein
VSAENALGEGPQSVERSATPSPLVSPTEPLPALDAFDRADENPLSDAGRWANGVIGSVENGLRVLSNQLACSQTTTCTAWRQNVQYGADVEVWTRVTVLPGQSNHIRLKARLQQVGTSGYDGYMLRTNQLAGTDEVYLERVDNSGTFVRLLTMNRELSVGDILLLRVEGSTLEAWVKSGSNWTRLGTATDSTYPNAGYVGIGLRGTTGRLDDFGARTTSLSVPGAPTALSATAGNGSVQLSWTAPFDGGSQITGYRIYRGTTSGDLGFLQSSPGTSFQDDTVTNGTTYYYKVSAENALGEGPLSNEASATPVDLDFPVEPLPILDNFNRANENPLSGGGSWTIGVSGSIEAGLYVTSNQLACNKSTTCTAYRSSAQYGADVEVWARMPVVGAAGSNLRLKARLQQVGSSGYDGYMLRTNRLDGTDEVYLERLDNAALVRLKTVSWELAANDTLLFRITDQMLEAWLKRGSNWIRLAVVSDSTYAAVGHVGIGLRTKNIRADDFGARALP